MNCLVKKLKANVDSFLPKRNELNIVVEDSSKFKIIAKTTNYDVVARADSAILYALDNNGEKTGSATSELTISSYGIGIEDNTEGKTIYLSSKSTIKEISIYGCSTNLTFCPAITSIVMDKINSKNMPVTTNAFSVTVIGIPGEPNGVSLNNINPTTGLRNMSLTVSPSYRGVVCVEITEDWCKNHRNISTLSLGDWTSSIGTPNFENLGFITSLAYYTHDTKSAGSIEGFVANARASSRTVGSMTIQYGYNSAKGGIITFQGVQITKQGSANTNQISWTANTITVDGVTINA